MVRRILAATALVAMAGCTGGEGGGSGLSIEIDGPLSPAYTNGVLTFQIDVKGGHPERVELRRDGALLAEVGYPYLFAWDTAADPEGLYTVLAVAIDGEKTVQSDPVSVTVDRTAPAIVERSPLDGATDVDVYGMVTVLLDEAVDIDTVDLARIDFANGTPINGASLSADGKTLTLPAGADFLPVPNVATVDLSDVRDLAGNPVDAGNWNFELPAWLSLGAADRVPTSDASEPAIAVDATDHPVVAFLEEADLMVSRWNGTAWVALGDELDAVVTNEIAVPCIAVDASDAPIAAWIEWDATVVGSPRELRTARWSGSAWIAMGAALNETAGDASNPVLLGNDGAGAPMIAWNEGGRVRVSRHLTGAWQPVGAATLPAAASARGTYLTSGNNVVRLVYRAPDAAVQVLRLSGSTWQAEGAPVSLSGREDLSITFDDYYFVPVVAVAEEDGNADFHLQVRQFDGASTWYDIAFPPTASIAAANPRLTNAPIGNGGGVFEEGAGFGEAPPIETYPSLQIVWSENGDVKASVFDFFEWAPMGAADYVTEATAAQPAIAHDGVHGVYLTWHEDDDGARSVRIGRMNRR